jgi:hypothetical protein
MLLEPREVEQQRLLLRGAAGAGKSVLLAATAERLRKAAWCAFDHLHPCKRLRQGPLAVGIGSVHSAASREQLCACRIVMYVPDCQDITTRNMFYSRSDATGMYDTRDAAQNILRSVAEAHGKQLRRLPQQVEGGAGSLLDLCTLSESASDVRLCDCVQASFVGSQHVMTAEVLLTGLCFHWHLLKL